MKYALISPNEIVVFPNGATGQRVAQVESSPFEVAKPLFWVECNDDVVADWWYYDPNDNTLKPIPQPESTVDATS